MPAVRNALSAKGSAKDIDELKSILSSNSHSAWLIPTGDKLDNLARYVMYLDKECTDHGELAKILDDYRTGKSSFWKAGFSARNVKEKWSDLLPYNYESWSAHEKMAMLKEFSQLTEEQFLAKYPLSLQSEDIVPLSFNSILPPPEYSYILPRKHCGEIWMKENWGINHDIIRPKIRYEESDNDTSFILYDFETSSPWFMHIFNSLFSKYDKISFCLSSYIEYGDTFEILTSDQYGNQKDTIPLQGLIEYEKFNLKPNASDSSGDPIKLPMHFFTVYHYDKLCHN